MERDDNFLEFLKWMRLKEMLETTADILKRGKSAAFRYAASGFPKQEESHLETVHFVLIQTKKGYQFLKKKGFETEVLHQFLEEYSEPNQGKTNQGKGKRCMELTEKLDFIARGALLAATGWALYQGCHLMEAIDDLKLMIPMSRLLSPENRDLLSGSDYGQKEKLARFAKAIADSLVISQQQSDQTEEIEQTEETETN